MASTRKPGNGSQEKSNKYFRNIQKTAEIMEKIGKDSEFYVSAYFGFGGNERNSLFFVVGN
jgi:hypothetical protein